MRSKYSTFLTILLVVLIIVILAIATIMGVKIFKDYTDEKETSKQIAELQSRPNLNKKDEESEENETEGTLIEVIGNNTNTNTNINTTTEEEQTSSRPRVPLYKNYPTIGYISIKKTNVKYPILIDASPGALETAVSVMYPVNPELNKKGNVVIIGHNYRNGTFFSNNKKLVTGDKIEITDLEGNTLTYTIYEIFETTPNDTEYITRERGDNIEISLSTCTDDGDGRLIILAKVE